MGRVAMDESRSPNFDELISGASSAFFPIVRYENPTSGMAERAPSHANRGDVADEFECEV